MSLSFIIPAYNAESFIVSCVDSILNLDIDDIEIIVVDDGSSDHTATEVKKRLPDWNRHQQKVTLLKQPNAGVSSARNHALVHTTKEWITFVDADDLILPQFRKAYELINLQSNDTDVFVFDLFSSSLRDVSDVSSIHCQQSDIQSEIYDRKDRLLLMENTLGFVDNSRKLNLRLPNSPGKIYNKKRIIDRYELKFPVGVKNGEDLLFNLQVWEHAEKVVACHFPIYLYYTNINSLTHRFKPDIKEITYLFFNNLKPIVDRHPELVSQYHSSMVQNFFIEVNQFLFHRQNSMNIRQRWTYFKDILNGYYKDSFSYPTVFSPKTRFTKTVYQLVKRNCYITAFSLFLGKYITKCIIKK